VAQLQDNSQDEFDTDYESDDLSNLGGAEVKALISLKQMQLSLRQFAKRMGQPNFTMFDKWKNIWVAGHLEKKYQSIIPELYCFKQQQDGPLHWEMAVADFWRLSRNGGLRKSLIMLNGFSDSGWRCVSRKVQVKFRR